MQYNIHNLTLFCNSAPRDGREHVVPQLYGFYFQKISLKLPVYPKKKITYKKVLNALKMQLEGGGKKKKKNLVEHILPLM